MTKSAYIHIPFCKQKCKYCSFISFTDSSGIESYINALLKDINYHYKQEKLNTLYFGGGTPSLIEAQYYKQIINSLNLSTNCEISFEINPDDARKDYLKALYDVGINRLSIGAQTFNDDVLNLIGRRHNSMQIKKAVELTKDIGFKNISLDLIYGLPNSDIKKDLEEIQKLDIQHISTYGLKIEENSFWGNHRPNNLPDDDMQADMYLEVNDYLENNGYKRYEISNFSLEGFESKHNLNYWNNDEYYGFGLASHGYKDGIRYSNPTDLQDYINNPIKHELEHSQTLNEIIEEEIFLGLRKTTGINIQNFKKKFGFDFETKYKKILDKYSPKYIIKDRDNYKLTINGILLSNNILAEFL